jgi:CheY-like chemotaxis protein
MSRKSKALDALFGARHEVIFATYLEPPRWWTREELARHLECAPESLRADLEILSGGEILRSREAGETIVYQANSDCPFFAEIQAIIAKAATRDIRPGSETILLVDDQAPTLKVAQILLESFGYKVLAAESGQQALILFRQHQPEIKLVLTDVVMPDIQGPQLAQRLRLINPALKVIYMSGYANEELRQKGVAFLSKPFNPAGLAKLVRDVLDG